MATATISTALNTTDDLKKNSPCLSTPSKESGLDPTNNPLPGLNLWSRIKHNLYTLWLFTHSDIKTVIVPTFVFGVSNALAAPAYNITTDLTASRIAYRAPLCLLWTWAQLLPVDIANQNSPGAIAEDGLNKPWRPMPAGRLTPAQASQATYAFYAVALLISGLIGGPRQGLGLAILNTWYNGAGGADRDWFVRNFINAAAYVCLTSGAMEVMMGHSLAFQPRLAAWFAIICVAFCLTIQMQDMGDQEGDSARGRKTLPLVVGDGPARWMTVVPILASGVGCPWFWDLGLAARTVSAAFAAVVAGRCLFLRTVEADKRTYLIYNLWMASIFLLPMLSQMGW